MRRAQWGSEIDGAETGVRIGFGGEYVVGAAEDDGQCGAGAADAAEQVGGGDVAPLAPVDWQPDRVGVLVQNCKQSNETTVSRPAETLGQFSVVTDRRTRREPSPHPRSLWPCCGNTSKPSARCRTGGCSGGSTAGCCPNRSTTGGGSWLAHGRSVQRKRHRPWPAGPTTCGTRRRACGSMPACRPTEVARRLGHSVAVLLRVYANCIDGGDDGINERISGALRARCVSTPAKSSRVQAVTCPRS